MPSSGKSIRISSVRHKGSFEGARLKTSMTSSMVRTPVGEQLLLLLPFPPPSLPFPPLPSSLSLPLPFPPDGDGATLAEGAADGKDDVANSFVIVSLYWILASQPLSFNKLQGMRVFDSPINA